MQFTDPKQPEDEIGRWSQIIPSRDWRNSLLSRMNRWQWNRVTWILASTPCLLQLTSNSLRVVTFLTGHWAALTLCTRGRDLWLLFFKNSPIWGMFCDIHTPSPNSRCTLRLTTNRNHVSSYHGVCIVVTVIAKYPSGIGLWLSEV